MDKLAIKLECLKMGLALTSPTVADRTKEVVHTAKILYDEIIATEQGSFEGDTLVTKVRGKPGRKPKPPAE